MRHTRLAVILSAIATLVCGAGCSDDSSTAASIDARPNAIDARIVDGSTAHPDATVSTADGSTAGIDAPLSDLDAPTSALDAPVSDIDAVASDLDAPASSPDAAPTSSVPDITGSFLFAISPHLAGQTLPPLQLIATVTLNSSVSPPKVTIHIQYLAYGTGQPADRTLVAADQIDFTNIDVNTDTNSFSLTAASLVIPGAANVTGQDITATNVAIVNNILSTDFFCGTLDGSTGLGSINGSTVGATRATPGATGADLPAPVLACPPTKRAR